MITPRRFIARLLAAACLPLALAAAEPIPVRAFFEPPAYSLPKVSPDGKHLTLLHNLDNHERIMLLDLATMQPRQIGLLNPDSFVLDYWWKDRDQLLLIVGNDATDPVFRTLNINTQKSQGLSSLNERKGKLTQILTGDPDSVLVSANSSPTYNLAHAINSPESGGYDLRRVNVKTGKVTVIEKSRIGVINWITNTQGDAVAAFGREDRTWFMLTRKDQSAAWTRITLGGDYLPQFQPVAMHPDQHRLIGWDFTARPTVRAVTWDPATTAMDSLFQSPEADADRLITWGDDLNKPVAIGYEFDRPQRQFIEPKAAAIMAKIDAALPDRINTVTSRAADDSVLVVHSRTDRNPGEYYLLNTARGQMSSLGGIYPALPEASMSASSFFHFKSRDGVALTGRILLPREPAGKPPLLLVVGPRINGPRAHYDFMATDQLLANRGYAVARINYRGIRGLGQALFESGDKQVALGAPRDLEDGVRWLIEQGWVDPGRIGLMGEGHGGLVAMNLLVQTQLFAAWINLNSPSNPDEINVEQLYRPGSRNDILNIGARASASYGQRIPIPLPNRILENITIANEQPRPDEVIAKLDGIDAAWAYRKSLDPRPLLARIKIPSFHYYDFEDGGLEAESYAKKAGGAAIFIRGHDSVYNSRHYQNHLQASREQQVETYTQLLAFLEKHLPAGGR